MLTPQSLKLQSENTFEETITSTSMPSDLPAKQASLLPREYELSSWQG
jgi:hypothetical protein